MSWLRSPSTVIVEPKKDPLEKGMATHSSVFAWRIPWTEEPGGLQAMGSQSKGCQTKECKWCSSNPAQFKANANAPINASGGWVCLWVFPVLSSLL